MRINSILVFIISALFLFPSSQVTAKQDTVREKADKVLVEKGKRKLTLFSNGKKIRTYGISLGRNPKGPKIKKGDKKTPEGFYKIDSRQHYSQYHLALHISYPNSKDRAHAERLKVDPGGNIMIHGIKNGFGRLGKLHRLTDWTQGCIAVTNEEIEEIWNLVPIGTSVEIRP